MNGLMTNRSMMAATWAVVMLAAMTFNPPFASAGDHAKALKYIEEGNASLDEDVANAKAKQYHGPKFKAAISSYDQAIAEAPDLAEAYFNKGVALIWLNWCSADISRVSDPVACFKKVLEISPDSAEAYLGIANAYFQIKLRNSEVKGESDWQTAKEEMLKALNSIPPNANKETREQAARLKADIQLHEKSNIVERIRKNHECVDILERWGNK
jgi:tetratricopeptide (TPR) repeat protein